MSDYARVHDFTTKDGLTTGDPNKVIRGSEVDAELDAIGTMSGTKVDEPASPQEGQLLVYQSGAWVAVDATFYVPVGKIDAYGGSSAPNGWLLCDGSGVSTTTYSSLFAILGYTYGGAGATFNLPDLRGRAIFGKDDMGGAGANRLTSGSAAGVDGDTLGASGGVEEHQLTEAEMPAHTHTGALDDASTAEGGANSRTYNQTRVATGSTGGDTAHTNVPPALVLNYIIKT